jgi:hypothetical protein
LHLRISLIDERKLAELMIDFGVSLAPTDEHETAKVQRRRESLLI